ncbi:Cu-Zn family superoxide dismutase [Epilithonimonas hungarica]|jgi:Cu/Zn superoxide dismutase|uniref:superoxide dismutase family protein n=1 Tax=Epilithonimonas hungarica TaxID=454006 RepID=UPI0012C48671|nr:superoxide dismutase family protein [Epilithonimonas hungarica]MDP9957621.1 Cu-Zn family superoxide dismutase [Epilithonimonas hungarica]MPT30984.1 superoxide dismutase family protein [Chryseobacterium sp.]
MKNLLLVGIAGLSLASCKTVSKQYIVRPKSHTETQGTANFTQKKGKVEMDLSVFKLTPGLHAVHIHEFGNCSATDASSAGGHWNPSKDDHGKWDTEHFHMGDIGNLQADKNGQAQLIFTTDKWCLGCDDPMKNIIGKAIVIHAGVDDFHTQPTGNAGGRVGCVEIK